MTNNENTNAPSFNMETFTCPHCQAIAAMKWNLVLVDTRYDLSKAQLDDMLEDNLRRRRHPLNEIHLFEPLEKGLWQCATCSGCKKISLWRNGFIEWPNFGTAPAAHEDMPKNIAEVFDEARKIAKVSPCAASALLRLVVERICDHFECSDGSLWKRIEELMEKEGCSVRARRAAHILREVGNDQVHAGTINLNENPYLADGLFKLANLVIEETIAKEKLLNTMENDISKPKT